MAFGALRTNDNSRGKDGVSWSVVNMRHSLENGVSEVMSSGFQLPALIGDDRE